MFKKVTGRPVKVLWTRFALFYHKRWNPSTVFAMKEAKTEIGWTASRHNSVVMCFMTAGFV